MFAPFRPPVTWQAHDLGIVISQTVGVRHKLRSFHVLSPSTGCTDADRVADPDPRAYDKLVERLLKSPHFGERMALEWLDAARYADTNGFSIDGGRQMWLWRDWVIQAFNDNKPYDRFLIEQLAGDLLPDRTNADLIASGFQRNNMVTHEGGTIPEENLANYNADRVKVLGEAVLGLTVGCAQCHNHKFDPITQRDYYQLVAFFNTLADRGLDGNAGINPGPSIEVRTVLRTEEVPGLRDQIASLKKELANPEAQLQATWEERERERLATRGRDLKLLALKVLKVSTPNRGAGFEIEDGSRVRLRQAGDLGAFDISTELPREAAPITGLRVIAHPVAELPGGGWGNGPTDGRGAKAEPPQKGTFVLTAIATSVDAIPGDQVNLHKLQPISQVTASSWDKQFPPADCLDPRNHNGWSPDLAAFGPVHVTIAFAEPIRAETTPFLTVQLNFGFGKNMVPGLVELVAITGTDDDTDLPSEVLVALTTPVTERTPEMKTRLGQYGAAHAPANRLGLAQWLTMKNHPLTARVAVNRVWQMLFGTGLVATAADFGAQGDWPSHPALLDWLAVDFVASGWDVKHLVRRIVTSATYRQSSVVSAEGRERDPSNRLLARGPRFRLPAEFVRDQVLQVSGLLVRVSVARV